MFHPEGPSHGLWAIVALYLALMLWGLIGAAEAQAPQRDVQGSRDHPMVGRYDGSVIAFYKPRDYDEMRLPTVRIRGRALADDNSIAVQGRAVRALYRGPMGRSSLEVARNFEQRLASLGFETLFFCRTDACGGQDLWFVVTDQLRGAGLPPNWESQTYLAARLKRAEGDVHVAILSVEQGAEVRTLIDVIETRPMETDKIRVVDAAAMRAALDATGRVALYGLYFDTDRAVIRPDSKPQLDEITRFLKDNPAVAVIVAGHTDNQGAFDYNIDLSRRRAVAVVEALRREGIPQGRLTAFGAGMAAPVATNDTPDGRAKNRRVEIVKR